MLSVTRTLDELVDQALDDVSQVQEIGYQVKTSSTLSAVDTTVTLVDASRVNVTDVIEIGDEIVLVTAKSAAATPVLTISRGYDRSEAVTHASGDLALVNPAFPRRRVAEAVKRSFTRLDANRIFNIETDSYNRAQDLRYVLLPEETRDVLAVWYHGTDGHAYPLDAWRFIDSAPVAKFATGKILNVPRYVGNVDDLEITIRLPWRWSSFPLQPDGDDTITIPEGCEDLPSLYAACLLITRREVSRLDIDRSSEWSTTAQVQGGAPIGIVRQMWQEFYRAVEEARTLFPQPIQRPFIRMRRFL